MLDRTEAWWPMLILLAWSPAGALSACSSSREKWYVLDGGQRHTVACAILIKVPVCWTLTLLVAVGFLGASRQLRIRRGDQGRDWRFVDIEFQDCFFSSLNTRPTRGPSLPVGEPMLASGSGARCTSTFNSLSGYLQVGRRPLGIQGRLIDRTKGGTTVYM